MGRVYYIDTCGEDTNDGLSPRTAWKSFQNINGTVLSGGDKLLLRRGCVWNEHLNLYAIGTPEAFAEIGAYGEGDRPKIERSGDISERCVTVRNSSYFKLYDLEVCNAGAGIVLFYDESYHNHSVYISNVSAHHFYGLYRGCGSSSKNPAWQSYVAEDRVGFSLGIIVTGKDTSDMNDERVLTDFRVSDCEIYQTGGGIGLDWCDHRCCDGSIVGKTKFGNVVWERLHLYDNDVADVSLTSMFLQCVTGAVLRDTVIDNGAGGAPWGTAAIHLQLAKDVLIENVEIKNMPHTNVSDECGIDFETDVENCIIRGCSFENNAGAAIEFLCNFEMSPMAVSRNVVIEQCDFVHNNWAVLYNNPAQILVQIWQHDNCPSVTVRDCRFSNPDGVVEIGGDGILDLFQTEGNVVLNATAVSAAM